MLRSYNYILSLCSREKYLFIVTVTKFKSLYAATFPLSIKKLTATQWLVIIKHCIQGSLHYCGGLVPTPMFKMVRLIFIFIEPQVLLVRIKEVF